MVRIAIGLSSLKALMPVQVLVRATQLKLVRGEMKFKRGDRVVFKEFYEGNNQDDSYYRDHLGKTGRVIHPLSGSFIEVAFDGETDYDAELFYPEELELVDEG
jgi:hypothetical protein